MTVTKVAGLEMHAVFHPHEIDTAPDMLKDCPFCGATAGFTDGNRRGLPMKGGDAYTVAAGCSNTSCGIRTPEHYKTREDAAYAWNRRPGDPPKRTP